MRTIACQNLKGGSGKTTSIISLASCLAERNKKILVIDMDAQGSIKESFGISYQHSLYDLLIDNISLSECIIHVRKGIDCIVSDNSLAACETLLVTVPKREEVLKRRLTGLTGYDFVLLDCSPSLSLLNQNALVFAEELLVPVSMDYLSLVGAEQIIKNLDMIENYFDKRVRILGFIPTFYDPRTRMSKEVLRALKDIYNGSVMPPVRVDTKIKQASSSKLTIIEYNKNSRGSQDYRVICDRILYC